MCGTRLIVIALALAGCGDNLPPTCEVPDRPLPTTGDYVDPYALPLPLECVDAGLHNAMGRWFVRDPAQIFAFDYPRIEGTCADGLERTGDTPDDHDASDDGYTKLTWSDGTRFFQRREYTYMFSDGSTYSWVAASVYCMLPDDQLAAVYVTSSRFNDDEPYEQLWHGGGTRFARKHETSSELELVGELGRTPDDLPIPAVNLVVDGGFAYLVGWLGLDVVDVADPSAPVHVAHLDGSFNDIRVVHAAGKRYVVLAPSGGDRTLIVDVTTPSAPQTVSVIDEYSHSLQIQQRAGVTELYLANGEDDVPVFDITNPLLPIKQGNVRVAFGHGVHDLTVDGDHLYVNDTSNGFVALDRSTGFATPTVLGKLQTSYSHASWLGDAGGRRVLVHGDEGMTGTSDGGAFMRVLDGDPSSAAFMTELGRYQTRPEVGLHNIEMHGTRAYIAYYQDGVRIVDLSDPTSPIEVGHYNTWDDSTALGASFEGALGIRLVDGLVYVADDVRGLVILRDP